MSYIDIFIPLAIGTLLVLFPKLFTRATGEAYERASRKLRTIGSVLFGVAALYALAKLGEGLTQRDGASAKSQMSMHRVQAETPGDDGWFLAKSTEGSFSIQLPIPFNDFTVSATDSNSSPVKVYGVGSKSSEGLKFSVAETPVLTGETQTDLEELVAGLRNSEQTVSEQVKGTYADCPSVSAVITRQKSGAFVRYIRAPKCLYAIILEFPIEHQTDARELRARFFDSLKW